MSNSIARDLIKLAQKTEAMKPKEGASTVTNFY